MIGQILEVTRFNLLSVKDRLYSSLVIVVGIGAVVSVLVSILAMATGFQATLVDAASPDRAVVLRKGSSNEMSSGLDQDAAAVVAQLPGVIASSAELFAVADVPKRDTGAAANLPLRGVSQDGFTMRPAVKIVQGRMFNWGTREAIAGVKAAHEFAGVELGNDLPLRDMSLPIVGFFEADGGAYESELWTDVRTMQGALRRPDFSSLRLQFDPTLEGSLNDLVEEDKRLELDFVPETEYYSEQSAGTSGLITGFGYVVGVIMSIGAIFGALNTMYSAVSNRAREIATLRSLGFAAVPVIVSVMIEALLLALLGGVLGAVGSYLAFHGYTASTLSSGSFSQVAFDFAVTPELMVFGIAWAIILGFVGGLLPALQAVRMPIVNVLRAE